MENKNDETHVNSAENKKVLNKSNSIIKFKKRTFDNRLSSFYNKEAKHIYVPARVKASKNEISR